MMKKHIGAKCLVLSDSWDSVMHYRVEVVEKGEVHLREMADFQKNKPLRKLTSESNAKIFITPYAIGLSRTAPNVYSTALKIINISSAWIRTTPRYPIGDLITKLKEDKRLTDVPEEFILGCLKSLVASGTFVVWKDGRLNEPVMHLELSEEMLKFEQLRTYAGTFANELSSLSERVRNLVHHTGTVGTYRENLLQSLLRKSVPERYHVATGFIHRCPRQLDIIIYDKIEYAPLFREGDLVVVPAESVRAVIEVKTDLSKVELDKSLALLDQVSGFDDCKPPFFKGIFGFESKLSPGDIYREISDFYINVPESFNLELLPPVIVEPFQHVTSVCVLGHAYAQIDYIKTPQGQYAPTVVAGSSMTNLPSQAAFFVQHLLAFLKFGGLKPEKDQYISAMLGEDTEWTTLDTLTALDSWGEYFVRDEIGKDDHNVDMFEKHIESVNSWIKGSAWQH